MRILPAGGLAVVAAGFVLLPVAMVVNLPGEAAVKELVGIDPRGCDVRERGDAGRWRDEPDTPTLRDGPASTVLDDRVYLLGGIESFSEDFTRARSLATFEVFDVSTKRWETLPELPERLNHVQLAALDGAIYAFGGHTDGLRDGSSTAESWRYDVQRREWTSIAPMPTSRGGGAVGVLGGRAYVVGGKSGSVSVDVVESYDPATDSWERHAAMPTRRDHLAAAVSGGELFALGGRKEDEASLPTLESYDPRADRWTRLPDMPGIKAGFAFESTPSGLLALGGENLDRWTLYGSAYRYRPERRAWESLPGMAEPRHGYGYGVVGGRLYVFGGSVCSGFSPVRDSASTSVA